MNLRKHLAALAFATASAVSASAQIDFDVAINEVLYDPYPFAPQAGVQKIEIRNRDIQGANLNGWALGVSYPGSLQDNRTYWPFPSHFNIAAGGVATIHWMQDGIDSGNDYYTGSLDVNFICVTPPKALGVTSGGVALFQTTDCTLFNNFQFIDDYVQWGGSSYHEVQANAAGIWPSGTFVPLVPEGHSIAYDGAGESPDDWWHDKSQTIGLYNEWPGNAITAGYGNGCAGTTGVPSLGSIGGPPAMGNQSFHLRLDGALPGAPAIVGMSANPGATTLFGCNVEIDLSLLILELGPQTTDATGAAEFWLPVPDDLNLLGVALYFQGAVVDAGAPGGVVALSTAFQAAL